VLVRSVMSLQGLSRAATAPASSFHLFTQLFALLTNIGENSELAIQSLSRSAAILPVVFECMRTDTCPVELTVEAAQCLLLLTEDNASLCMWVGGCCAAYPELLFVLLLMLLFVCCLLLFVVEVVGGGVVVVPRISSERGKRERERERERE
jgi:hypothetical protein